MKGRVCPTGQVENMPRMMTRSMTARSANRRPPSEAASGASVSTIPPPTTPEDKRIITNAAARAHVDMAQAAAVAAGLAPSQPRPGTDEKAPSTCSLLSASTPSNTLREYQSVIASKCEGENTLVVLPTGTGKTMIAAEVIKRLRRPALVLVPKRILVAQQAKVLRDWTGLNVARCRGNDELPHMPFHVLVATAEAFRTAQNKKLQLFQWSSFHVVIFDEVHHMRKNDPYRKLALSLSSWCSSSSGTEVRVLGLTASYSYDFGEGKTKLTLKQLCRDLGITNTESRTLEELKAGGYTSTGAITEVQLPPATATPAEVLPEAERKSHEMVTVFFRREEQRSGTRFARLLLACIRSMENAVVEMEKRSSSQLFPPFTSPMPPGGKLPLRMWAPYACKLAHGAIPGGRRAGRRRDSNRNNRQPCSMSPVRVMLAELEHWYEAVRVEIVSWEEREDDCATILNMFECTGSPSSRASQEQLVGIWPKPVLEKIQAFWAQVPAAFPRYEHLKEVLLEKYEHHGGDGGGRSGGSSFRGIVFVRERVTTHVLAHVIGSDPILAGLFSTACLHSTSSAATTTLAVSEQEAEASIQAFRKGGVNLLLTTAAAEEGMDIPAANCVVCYDAVEHIVSLVQRRGRARAENSSFVVLSERADRTTEHLEAVEQRQRGCLEDFKPQYSNNAAEEVTGSEPSELDQAVSMDREVDDEELPQPRLACMTAGRRLYPELYQSGSSTETPTVTDSTSPEEASLERAACGVLLDVKERHGPGVATAANGTPIPPPGVLSAVKDFAEKTNAVLSDPSFRQDPVTGLWVCTLSYESSLRKVSASGEAVAGKKIAQKLAAAKLITHLIETTDVSGTDSVAAGMDEHTHTDGTWAERDESIAATSEQLSATTGSCGFDDDLDRSEERTESDIASGDVRLVEHQWSLERAARGVLLDVKERHGLGSAMTPNGTPIPPPGVLSAATDFVGKTNAVLLEPSFRQDPATRLWVCALTYHSVLRKISSSGEAASGKKTAKKLAAARLVADLLAVIPA